MSTREIHDNFVRGSVLIGSVDTIPENALRFMQNARLDGIRGTIGARPGITKKSAGEITSSAIMIHKRFDSAGDSAYEQTQLAQLWLRSTLWAGGILLGSTGTTQQLAVANMVDGLSNVWAHFVNGSIRTKSNGSVYSIWGIAPPANPPSSVALSSDLSTLIDAMNNAASWTGAGLSAGPTNEANITQGGGSVTFTIAANSIGSIGQGGFALNLDTLAGGDATVKDDDYIHLWLRCDRPDRVKYVQMDFDLDTTTLANAFRTNYYSVRLPGLSRLNQGRDQWSKLQVRKSEFQRFGPSTDDWGDVKSVRLSAMTNTDGAVQFYADDWKLRGGTDIEGVVEYAVAYRALVPGGRGNPALDAESFVRYTTKLAVDRSRVTITTANIAQGGVDHPGDPQIDLMIIYRRIDGGNSVNIDEILDNAAAYVDSVSVAGTLLNEVLEDTPDSPGSEAENDLPPLGDYLFGPGALNRLFMLQGKNRCYVSKAWQRNEHRAENWPPLDFFLVGDGSQQALSGVVSDTQILICTNAETYQVFGSSDDTFLPVPVPNSRGIVGRNAMDDGDGRVFIFAPDGLVEQIGNQQLLVVDIGETLASADIDLNTDPTALASIWLRWHADTHDPYVSILIPVGSATTPTHRLVVKKNRETGHYTDVILDSSSFTITCLFADDAGNALYGGASNGEIYQLEDHTVFSDAGSAVSGLVRTKAYHQNAPHRDKVYHQTIVEANTGSQTLTVAPLYDKEASVEAAETMNTATGIGTGLFTPDTPMNFHRDISLKFSWSATAQLLIYRFGWYYEVQPEALSFWDSGVILFPVIEALKRFDFDINAPALVVLQPWYDGAAGAPLTVLPTVGRMYAFPFVPPNIKTRTLRVTLVSTGAFRLYSFAVRNKSLGSIVGYTESTIIKGATA